MSSFYFKEHQPLFTAVTKTLDGLVRAVFAVCQELNGNNAQIKMLM